MNYRPRHPKPDKNQKQLLKNINDTPGFEAFDVSKSTDAVCPGDVLVHCIYRQQWQLFEVKDGPDADVSPAQQARHDDGSVPIVYDAVAVLAFFGAV